MDLPRLRKVERIPLDRAEESLVVLRDPWGLADPLAVDAAFAPVLDMLDGTRTVQQIRHSLLLRGDLDVPVKELADFVADLGDCGLLDNDRFRELWAEVHAAFMASPSREPRLAGVVYPEDPAGLAGELARVLHDPRARKVARSEVVAVVCPHQAYGLAAPVLAETLTGLPAGEAIDLVVVLGTDHGPGLLPYVIGSKPWSTPLGEVAVAGDVVAAIERRVPWVRREEIRLRNAPAVELALPILQHLYGRLCPPIVPVLCGASALEDEGDENHVDAFIAAMELVCESRRVLWWTSAELSHAGPAYGRPSLGTRGRTSVTERDRGILDSLVAARGQQLARRCKDPDAQGRPSGGATLWTLAQLLPIGATGQVAAYDLVRVPGPDEGWAGLAGVRFEAPPE